MKPSWKRFAPWGLYLALAAALVAFGLYFVQREWNTAVQVALALTVLGLAAFALLDPDRVRRVLGSRQARHGTNTLVMGLAFVGILVVINLIGYQRAKRWDLTEDRTHTLAPETLDTLAAMPQPVEALAFFTARMPSAQARTLLEDYKAASDGRFDYHFIDPESEPLLAQQEGVERDGTIVLKMGDQRTQVAFASEQEITGALVRLLNPAARKVYFLTGHGERNPDDFGDAALSQAKSALQRKNYGVETLNLLAVHSIPEDAAVIVIAGPTQPLSEEEMSLLRDYVAGGGALIVMEEPLPLTDYGDAVDPLAEYLATDWGITLGRDMVVDLTSNQPLVAIANEYGSHPITDPLSGLVSFFPTARSVQVGEAPAGISPVEIVRTAPQSWAETDLETLAAGGNVAADSPDDLTGPVPVAAAAEDFGSGARVAVFGDADFPANATFDAYGNGDLFVNAVDWAAGEEQLINLTPKSRTQRILIPPSRMALGLIALTVLIVIPGLTLAAGVAVWVRRRRRL